VPQQQHPLYQNYPSTASAGYQPQQHAWTVQQQVPGSAYQNAPAAVHQAQVPQGPASRGQALAANQIPSRAAAVSHARPPVNNRPINALASQHQVHPANRPPSAPPGGGITHSAFKPIQQGARGKESTNPVRTTAGRTLHPQTALAKIQGEHPVGTQLDGKSVRATLERARANGRRFPAGFSRLTQTAEGKSDGRTRPNGHPGKSPDKVVKGANSGKVFASLVPSGRGGKPALALAPESTLAALGAQLGLLSPYGALEADLISKIEKDIAKGKFDPTDLAMLNSLIALEETDALENLGALASSCMAGGFCPSFGSDGSACDASSDTDSILGTPSDSSDVTASLSAVGGACDTADAPDSDGMVQVGQADSIPSTLACSSAEASQVMPASSTQAQLKVVLDNPDDSGGALSYVLAGSYPYTIEAGYAQVLTGKPSWLIEFDRGGSFGSASYDLGPGSYTFTVTEKGWELYNTLFTVVLDNTANQNEFNFIQDGRVQTVKAGEFCTLSGKYAIVISFDRGDGGAPCEKTCKSGTYRIGLNDQTKLLDLQAVSGPESSAAGQAATASR